jgi:hypothetical protein
MKPVGIPILAAIGGFVVGMVLSEWIGIIGFLVTGEAMGIRYLPIFLAVMAGMIAIVVQLRRANL